MTAGNVITSPCELSITSTGTPIIIVRLSCMQRTGVTFFTHNRPYVLTEAALYTFGCLHFCDEETESRSESPLGFEFYILMKRS